MRILLVLFLLAMFLFAFENNFGTHGYIRIQTSLQNNKEDTCFKVPGSGSKYRLGNECETWGELSLFQDITLENGIRIHNEILPVLYGSNNDKVDYLRTDGLYSEVFNLFDNSVSFWIGRRWYKRYDSHMSDYFYFNMSGDGFGINNLDLGSMSVSYSFMFNEIDPAQIPKDEKVLFTSHDLRLQKDIERGKVTLFVNYMHLDGANFNTGDTIKNVTGYALGLLYTDTQLFKNLLEMDGKSISGIFYGNGLARGAGSHSPYLQESLIENMLNKGSSIESSKTWRFINYNDFQNSDWGLMSNLVYEYKDDENFSNTKQEWISIGVRPYLFFHKNVRALLELGYDHVKDQTNKKSYALLKTTSAIEFAFDKGIWKRPVLRVYYTKASWNNEAQGLIGGSRYFNKTSGTNAGVQLEYWW